MEASIRFVHRYATGKRWRLLLGLLTLSVQVMIVADTNGRRYSCPQRNILVVKEEGLFVVSAADEKHP